MVARSERTPWDEDDGVTQLQEDVLGLLEEAGIPSSVNDQICRLIEQAEKDPKSSPRAQRISDAVIDAWDRLRNACERVECSLPHQLSTNIGDLSEGWRAFHEVLMKEAK